MKTFRPIERITLTIIGIILFQTAYSQENFLPGYIVPFKGDTVHGFIDYRNWDRNPDKIFFKEKNSDNKVYYTPNEIKAFHVLDEVYVSAIVETEVTPDNTNDLLTNKELKIKIDTAFLQTMINGTKSLYFYQNISGKAQFYIMQGGVYDLLIHKRYLLDLKETTLIAENKKYVGQLTYYLQDCPTIQSIINETKYNKESLENLFQRYYNETRSGMKFQKKTEKYPIEYGILAGMSSTSLKFSDSKNPELSYAKYSRHSENFMAGLFLDLVLARNNGKISICNELTYSSYKINGYYNSAENESVYTNTSTTFGYSYLKMINMLRYKYPIGNLFIYVNFGLSNGYVIKEENFKKTESQFYSTHTVEENKALDKTKKLEQGFVFGLGTKYKKFSFEIRGEKGNGFSDDLYLSVKSTRYYYLLGYKF